jgi:protein-L-isoaspartate O-methyltransferase
LDPAVSSAALAERYDAVPYDVKPHPLTHPDRLATVATFLGYSPAPPSRCRVLEVGCNDGSNLIPMAVSLPGSTFVGCDLSPNAIAAGKATLAAIGVTNVTLLCEDLAALDPALGPFDYIVAHGVYSWVPAPVRDALFALAADRLAANGILFVSYNTFPGCRVRQAAWDMLHHHVAGIPDMRARLEAARALARLVADGGHTQHPPDDALRSEMRSIAERTDSQLFHDDLAVPNDPVHFRDFAAHAADHGLAYLAEAELHTMSAAGISAAARQFLSTLDPLAREQYLDFVRLRRFRQSLLRRQDAVASRALHGERLAAMHVSADPSLLRATEAGKLADMARELDASAVGGTAVRRLLEELVRRAPAAMSVADVRALLGAGTPAEAARPLETLLRDAYVGGVVNLHLQPPPLVGTPSDRPRASPLARWQAVQQQDLTNLVQTRVRVPDPNARRLLQLLDGTRDRKALVAATEAALPAAHRAQAAGFVDHALLQFARLGLLAA